VITSAPASGSIADNKSKPYTATELGDFNYAVVFVAALYDDTYIYLV
jgi:hypothetical protein